MQNETVKQIPGDLPVVLTRDDKLSNGQLKSGSSVGSSQGSKIAKQI